MNITKWILCLGACALGLQLHAAPMGSAFTYQGRVNLSGVPAPDGLYDFQFTLFNALTGGSAVGSVPASSVPVTNGLFTVQLDFGTPAFTSGEARWLELQVNTITLNPRQRLTPTPQAIYAGTAASVAAFAVGTAGLANDAVTSVQIADETIDADDLNPTLLNNTFWRLTGNGGTDPNFHFLGTIDNRSVVIKANNVSAFRIEPNVNSPNLIGGSAANAVTPGSVGGTAGQGHFIAGAYSTIAGGVANTNTANYASIGGGLGNLATGPYAVVGGGSRNAATGQYATTAGGLGHTASGSVSTVAGGANNIATQEYAAIGGGGNNRRNPNQNNKRRPDNRGNRNPKPGPQKP